MGYEQFFGLSDAPFSLAPNPRYLFESASHAHALQQLAYAIDRREPLVVLTGEIGSGKTLLCRAVLQRLGSRTFVSVINNPLLERDDFLKQMLQDFGVVSTDRTTVPTTSRHDLVHALEDFLSSLIALDAHAVVIIDEAQHVQSDVLEQIRLLSNIDAPSGTRLQILLVGQLDLHALLERPDLRQLQQRVSRRIQLEPLSENELRSYIEHRLAVGRAAGSYLMGASELADALAEWTGEGAGVIFTPDAVGAIWRRSGGLPRLVNVLCDRALEAAYDERLRTVDAGLVEAAAAQFLSQSGQTVPNASVPPDVDTRAASILAPAPSISAIGWRWNAAVVLIVVLAGAAGAAWFVQRTSPAPPTNSPSPASGRPAAVAPGSVAAPGAPALEPAAEHAPTNPPPLIAAPEPATAASAGRNATGPSFEIIVATFRTEARAAAVAAQVSDTGLAVHQRAMGEWQQVIAGPFASREEADVAHQRLDRAGLPGTHIAPVKP